MTRLSRTAALLLATALGLFPLYAQNAVKNLGPAAAPPTTNAVADPADDTDKYIAPEGKAPPVAPPLKVGSPLWHLAFDPRAAALPVGAHEGDTSGATYWVGHRLVDPMDGQGWGWIRKSTDGWGDAIWIALQETPGRVIAPHRKLLTPGADNDWEFNLWGSLAGYKAYDPRLDERLPVFVLRGYQVLGPANPLRNKVGPPGRIQNRASRASSRSSSPILSDPGVD